MALTLKQAQAVNTVLDWLLDPATPPLNDDIVWAAAILAEAAYDKLAAGITGPEVERRSRVCAR